MSDVTDKSKQATKRIAAIAGGLLIVGALQYQFNIIPIRSSGKAAVPTAVELNQDVSEATSAKVEAITLPSTAPAKLTGATVRANIWAWNAQMGLIFANGGPKTTSGSLMEKNGVKLTLIRQDNADITKQEQIKFAQKLADGDPNPADGVHFAIIMGDGAAQYIAGVNKALTKLGADYRAEVVGAVGYSGNSVSGEDAFMGPPEWRDDPTKAQGGLVSGYIRDGDWNLAMYWLQQNGIKNNPDETTYDPTALNWVAADDYIKAAEMYISGYCEDRKIVREGKITSEPKKHVCVQGAVTWTPGDVNIVKRKGGVVKLMSTKENAYQMPSVVIGIHKWNEDHPKLVQGFLKAAFEGGDQVRNYPAALDRAGKASYEVYKEESPAYWVKYYKGSVERGVPLGGSRVANLGDNLKLFGLEEGAGDASSSIFHATYTGFGNVAKQQYPKLVPDFPPTAEAVNLSFLQTLAATTKVASKAEPEEEIAQGEITDVVAKRNWNIQFNTGSATFTSQAESTLTDLYNQLVVGRLSVEIAGHTDNTGNPDSNRTLSEARANAVAGYLRDKAPNLFRTGRVLVKGYGPDQPIADNASADGRAKNRRVTVILGSK